MTSRWFYISQMRVFSLGAMSIANARIYEQAHPSEAPLYTAEGLDMLRESINYWLNLDVNAKHLSSNN